MICKMVEIESCNYKGIITNYIGRTFIDPDEIKKILQWNEYNANGGGNRDWIYIYYIDDELKVYCTEDQHKRNIEKFKKYYDDKKVNFSKRIFD